MVRAAARRLLPPPVRRALSETMMSRLHVARAAARPSFAARAGRAYASERAGRSTYRVLAAAELLATRSADTAFVFGSGKSLLDIGPAEWELIAEQDTVSFSEFPRQRFVRADYHMIGEVVHPEAYAKRIRENPLYADTVFLVQRGALAEMSNVIVGRRLLPPHARIFRYRRLARGRYAPPSRSLDAGLVHAWNSSISATNFAVAMGYSRVVLTGVDLYDREYFWLPDGARRETIPEGSTPADLFNMSRPVVELFANWRAVLEQEGVQLLVYNPRSLLAEVLPVFSW
jgi:hypothetical protein